LGVLREQYGKEGTGDIKTRETRRTIIRGWMAPTTDKQETEERMQRIVNGFFFGVTIFSVAFAYFVLSAKAQDHHLYVRATPGAFYKHLGACPTTKSCCSETDCYPTAYSVSDL